MPPLPLQSFRKDCNKENIETFPAPVRTKLALSSDSCEDSVVGEGPRVNKHKIRNKKSKEEIELGSSVSRTALNESEHEINVKIPTSDTTEVVVKVKPLDNRNLKNKRIHVRINQKLTPERPAGESRKVSYGRKSLISHHFRKTRPPLFSRKLATPKADRKQLLKNVIDFVEEAKREEAIAESSKPAPENKERLASLQSQKIIREKRTKTAQLRKLIKRIN